MNAISPYILRIRGYWVVLYMYRQISDHESVKTKCEWYNGINGDQTPIVFRCPRKQYMAGIKSNFFTDDRM